VNVDVATAVCNEADVPFDDHLGDISVPILYIGAARGFAGRLGYYNTTLTASRDITRFVVQLLPDDQKAYDFGHADLFMAQSAERLVGGRCCAGSWPIGRSELILPGASTDGVLSCEPPFGRPDGGSHARVSDCVYLVSPEAPRWPSRARRRG
jgi:hypothetical protein